MVVIVQSESLEAAQPQLIRLIGRKRQVDLLLVEISEQLQKFGRALTCRVQQKMPERASLQPFPSKRFRLQEPEQEPRNMNTGTRTLSKLFKNLVIVS